MAYRLKKSGHIVHTYRRSSTVNGRPTSVTRAVVGHEGQEFEELAEHVVEQIESGALDDIWEVVDEEQFVEGPMLDEEPETPAPLTDHLPPEHGHDIEDDHQHATNYEDLSNEMLEVLVELHELDVDGTGAQGKVLKRDMVAALLDAHGDE